MRKIYANRTKVFGFLHLILHPSLNNFFRKNARISLLVLRFFLKKLFKSGRKLSAKNPKTLVRLAYFSFVFNILFITKCLAAIPAEVIHIEYWKTSEGVPVYFVKSAGLPILDMRIIFRAGSAYDGAKLGLAWLTNQMMAESTSSMNADQIATAFDQVGARFTNNSDREQAYIQLRSMSDAKYLEPALTLFHNVLTDAVFNGPDIDRNKNQTIAMIQINQQQPDTVASDAFYAALYAGQPYAHSIYGSIDSINHISKDDLISFYKKYYVINNAIFVMVGNLTKEQAIQISNNLFSGLPRGEKAAYLPKAKAVSARDVIIPFPSAQANIYTGQVGITFQNPNFFPLRVANVVFGEGSTMRSRIFNIVREQNGLAYSVASQFIPAAYGGPFFIQLQTRADQAKYALKLVNTSLQNFIKDGPTINEVQDAKQYLTDRLPVLFSSNENIVTLVSVLGFYNLPLDYYDQYPQRINKVTIADIKSSFSQTVHPEQMITVIVGPTKNA